MGLSYLIPVVTCSSFRLIIADSFSLLLKKNIISVSYCAWELSKNIIFIKNISSVQRK